MAQTLEQVLEAAGLAGLGKINWNLRTEALYEASLRRGEVELAKDGPLVAITGQHTGRSPNDKFTVEESSSTDNIWWGKVNKPFPEGQFDALKQRLCEHLSGKEVFVQDCIAGADADSEIVVRVVTNSAWHALFARTMFIRPDDVGRKVSASQPDFLIIHSPEFEADPARDGTNSSTFIVPNFGQRTVIIGGSRYAGEIKKSVFFLMNYLLPQRGMLSMHASANIGEHGDSAIFFGLSGTGKTTLSADPARGLIGDDEHGWGSNGIFNFEGGCYAKVINLSREQEPLIYDCTRRYGTILENVVMDPQSREIDLDSGTLTENTRAAYPITHIPNAVVPGVAGHPKNVVMLTCDAFGVLPPISRLSPDQAMYHFISGYTAKVAGTERGVTEPQTTFSTCFGAPFMALHPSVYAKLLGEKIAQHDTSCWLINTGWSGGPYGVGKRMNIHHTRAMLNAALRGDLDDVEYEEHPVFRVSVPQSCPGVPAEILDSRATWSDKDAYDDKASELAQAFQVNFDEYRDMVPEAVASAGPAASLHVA